jgi:hypothetical protein
MTFMTLIQGLVSDLTGQISMDHNLFFGGINIPSEDSNALNVDPLFVNGIDDFHLQQQSPAKEAGNSQVQEIVLTDYDGYLRPQHDVISIGAYEVPNPLVQPQDGGTTQVHDAGVDRNSSNP